MRIGFVWPATGHNRRTFPKKAQFLQRLNRLFPDVPYKGDYPTRCGCLECDDIASQLTAQTWTQITPDRLDKLLNGDYLMTDKAYAYFLPACLKASLDKTAEARRIADCIIRGYIPSGPPTHSVDALNPNQLTLLCDWFDWVVAELESEWQDHFNENDIYAPGTSPETMAEEIANLREYVEGWRFSIEQGVQNGS